MNDSEDQVQVSEQEEVGKETDAATEGEDQEQSTEGEQGNTESKLYKLPDGREVSADDVFAEYGKIVPEFTRRSQKLRDFERAEEEAKSKAGQNARESIAQDELLKNVDPDVKDAIIKIVEPRIESALKGIQEKNAQQERDKAFTAELGTLEKKYPGGDGRPKFDRNVILEKMKDSSNRDFDPETVYEKIHKKELFDNQVKQALKKQRGGSQLETTGSGDGGKPQGKTPKTFAEAADSARSRI